MKKRSRLKSLVKELERDPRLKRVISKVKRQTQPRETPKIESVSDFLLVSLSIASRFMSKKKARSLDELMDVVYLLVRVSLLLKENIFDRPEVKKFFSHHYEKLSSTAQEYVAMILAKTKSSRHAHS
jgi:hypothetical protein